MKYKIKISSTAREDLLSISQFLIDEFGFITASIYVAGIEDTFLLLKRNPMLGRFHKGDIRSCVFKKRTVVFYTIENTTIYIIRIFDTRQDWSSFF